MWLTSFSLKNPVAVTLFYIIVVLVGLIALARMGRSILPPISIPVVSVTATYPGASSREIERLVIEPIEENLKGLPDLSRVSSTAQSGVAEIVIQFRFGTNVDVDRTNVQDAVDAARANLPTDLVPPVVSKDDPTEAPILELAVSSVILSQTELADIVSRKILPELRSTNGVGLVRDSGAATRQFNVRANIGALDALGGTPLDLLRAVAAGNDLLPGGLLRSPLKQSSIGIDASVLNADELMDLPVSIPGSSLARVRDVAHVSDGSADQSVISRVDGETAVLVFVSHVAGADGLGTITAVRKTVRRLADDNPDIRFEELRSDQPYTNAAIGGVLQTLGEGIILTVLVMLLFLHAWRSALIAAISIPTSLCASFIAMWAMGFSLNVLSLMGLSLTIGILVDDSIVIIEAIAKATHRGLRGDDAALAGRSDLGPAAFAITLVDVAVFLPIGLMNGIVGEFMREFALVIVFATAVSLLVSFTLTPLLTARWSLRTTRSLDGLSWAELTSEFEQYVQFLPWTMRHRYVVLTLAAWHNALNTFNRLEQRLSDRYAGAILPAALRLRKPILIIVGLACIGSLVPLFSGAIPAEFSPPVNRGELSFDLTMPPGTPLSQTDAILRLLTNKLLELPAIKHVETSAGESFNGSSDIFASNAARLGIVTTDPNGDDNTLDRQVRALNRLVPSVSFAGAGKGMGGTPAVSYDIAGSPGSIDQAANLIATVLRQNPYAADIRSSDLGIEPRINLAVDMDKARLLDISPDDAAQTARLVSGGTLATRARLDSGLVDVVVGSDAGLSGDLDKLVDYSVRSNSGERVPLADLTKLTYSTEPTIIQRENGERVVSVSANAASDVPISLLTSSVSRVLRDPSFLPPGTRIEPRGDIAQFLDTVGRMFAALGLSVIAVYVILATLYRSYALPLVVMLTVPLASIGAFGSLFALNAVRPLFPTLTLLQAQTLNLYSMLGIIMLVGLVAKNGILLVEYADRSVRAGANASEAILKAAHTRFRPILMTTAAMIVGMLPLALGHTVGAEYRKALGTVVIGGLSTSLFLTLFVIPIVYVWYRDRTRVRDAPLTVSRLLSARSKQTEVEQDNAVSISTT